MSRERKCQGCASKPEVAPVSAVRELIRLRGSVLGNEALSFELIACKLV